MESKETGDHDMTFRDAVLDEHHNLLGRTENDAETYVTTTNPILDLFFRIGALRHDPWSAVRLFKEATRQGTADDETIDLAVRCVLWARDARRGAGERNLFRHILQYAEREEPSHVMQGLIRGTPGVGRWDDLLVLETARGQEVAYEMFRDAIARGDRLWAKWMPRKGPVAARLRRALGYTPKEWRKLLVSMTDVVETRMCSGRWNEIEYDKVPSVAAYRYRKAFSRHDDVRYQGYVDRTVTGEEKVNVGAVTPVDVLKPLIQGTITDGSELKGLVGQWNQLEDVVGEHGAMLPVVDVSGSMFEEVSRGTRAVDVSVALGIYIADRQRGPFQKLVLTFSEKPEFVDLQTDRLEDRVDRVLRSEWGYNTDLEACAERILHLATKHRIPPDEMPRMLLVISDMEFDEATGRYERPATGLTMIRERYARNGYRVPTVVFWNVMSRRSNFPSLDMENGVVMVSGFSPQILRSVLSLDPDDMNPMAVVTETLMVERYDWNHWGN